MWYAKVNLIILINDLILLKLKGKGKKEEKKGGLLIA